MIAVARAAERSMGAALVPNQLSSAWFDAGSLVPLFKHDLITADAFYFVSKKNTNNNHDVQLFRDWVIKNFAETQ
jgi:DNA-binding transcriptional LysR family regulator